MLDFMDCEIIPKKGYSEIRPIFKVRKYKDLMIKGHDFFAIWDEENNTWSLSEVRAIEIMDRELNKFANEHFPSGGVVIQYPSNSSSTAANEWYKFKKRIAPDTYKALDSKIIFKSDVIKKEDYSSKRLDYDLEEGEPEAYNELFNVIFSEKELEKLEWAIGSIFSGDSKKIQKFIVLYGDPGTGKGTYLEHVVQNLFDGYYATFIAKDLASSSNNFALEVFKNNPLVGIQLDGDLSRIFDNTKLNSIISHEEMVINEKNKSLYSMKFNTFLFMGTNYPIEISSSKSGMNRRVIDVYPTGNLVKPARYDKLIHKLIFEKGKIANKCIEVYKRLGKNYYNTYSPEVMKHETDEFYNFIEEDYYSNIKDLDYVRANEIYGRYKKYCEDNNVRVVYSYSHFRSELKGYFKDFEKDTTINNVHIRNVYLGFRKNKLGIKEDNIPNDTSNGSIVDWIHMDSTVSLLDDMLKDCLSQYAKADGTPKSSWGKVTTTLSDIRTDKLHYIRVPSNHIVIDFDLKDENGNKSQKLNLEAANKWPKTYAEYSKSGSGIHLHYIYDGDINKLATLYAVGIEVKTFSGLSALRRKLTKCNDIPVAHIINGLPIKENKKVLNFDGFKSEKQLRKFIQDCFDKKHHGATKPEVDFIAKALDDIYESGMDYDVRDLRYKTFLFCIGSSNQSDSCKKIFNKMHFCSKNFEEEDVKGSISTSAKDNNAPIIFLDIEVFPNLLLICYKFEGKGDAIKLFNPDPAEVEELFKFRIVGFNNRRYDNHIIYARSMGYSIKQCFNLSQKIISNKTSDAFIGEAYNLSYTDIYDYCATKQSLKKWEIKLGIHHQELGLAWDKDAPKDLWDTIASYCVNDVVATEAVFNNTQADFTARKILADISGLSVNDTTNQHTIRIIIGDAKNPQREFIYTNLATGERSDGQIDKTSYFHGYIFNEKAPKGEKSLYKGIYVGEGGHVYAEPGMYGDVGLLDIASMHPTSIEMLEIFGPYTKNFTLLKLARIYIKHKDYESAGKLFDGKLKPYLTDADSADALSYALKIAINSVYGLTAATFPNKLRDPRNIDNIVAKRGALFMVNLCEEVTKKGYKVVHIKTDSIKIANIDDEITQFVMDYGKKYGYIFEYEALYDRICLVNNAVYIAKYKEPHKDKKTGKDIWWTATGAEFAHPYIFKTLFSKEEIEFNDLCEVKAVKTDMYLSPDDENYIFVGKVGSFVPMKNGHTLYRIGEDKEGNVKYDSVTGTKGYKWLESEYVKNNNLMDDIDYSYFNSLIEDARSHISKFGDFNVFVSEEPIPIMYESKRFEEEVPF